MKNEQPDGATLERIRLNTKLLKEQAAALLQKEVGCDKNGVQWLDGFIRRQRERGDANDALIDTLGCFYGECIRQTYGGSWLYVMGQLAIYFSEGSAAFPFSHIIKHLEDDEDNAALASKFAMIGSLIEAGQIKVDQKGTFH
jgi:hypothetical protein